jgi:putative transposase
MPSSNTTGDLNVSVHRRFDRHQFPSLVTTNTEGRAPVFASPIAAKMLLEVMGEVRRDTDLDLTAWVVMPDHVHLVLRLPSTTSTARVMKLIKGRFAWRFNRRANAMGSVWQSRYHERVLTSDAAFERAVDYVHWNPVRAGLAQSPGEFRWSSARNAQDLSG